MRWSSWSCEAEKMGEDGDVEFFSDRKVIKGGETALGERGEAEL